MFRSVCFLLFLVGFDSHALEIHFNQAWFKNNYGHQYLSKSFDSMEVERVFKLNKEAGSSKIRLWFFEDLRMVNFKKGIPVSLRQDYNENVLQTFRLVKASQIKIYMTLFDAHQFNPFKYKWKNLRKLRSIVAGKNQDAFLRNILIPLLSALKAENLIDVIDKVDLMNEMDAFINRFGFWNKWQGSKNMLCKWNSVIDEVEKFPVSYSVRLHPLTPLPLSFF